MSTLKYYVWLQGRVAAQPAGRLLRHFGSAEAIYFAGEDEYKKVEEIKSSDIASLKVKELTTPTKILAKCAELDQRIVTLQDAEYPARLKNIYDPPVVLYVKGRLPAIDEEAAIAIVGTRKSTPYGLKTAENLGYELARHGLLVVTGLARGGDTAAAVGALRGGGNVIGVLGCGIDVVYPKENGKLYEDVAACGALVSEYPPGTEVSPSNFPVRNRIMSGLSIGVAVIEAPKRSGTLITASRALEQGRDVFAVPGNVDAEMSIGANLLLREGAIPLTSAMDIVSEYAELYPLKIKTSGVAKSPLDKKLERELLGQQNTTEKTVDKSKTTDYIDVEKKTEPPVSLSGAEKVIYDTLRSLGGTAHIDEIISASGLPASEALSAMTMLELDGNVAAENAGFYRI